MIDSGERISNEFQNTRKQCCYCHNHTDYKLNLGQSFCECFSVKSFQGMHNLQIDFKAHTGIQKSSDGLTSEKFRFGSLWSVAVSYILNNKRFHQLSSHLKSLLVTGGEALYRPTSQKIEASVKAFSNLHWPTKKQVLCFNWNSLALLAPE